MDLKIELLKVNKEIKALTKEVEKLIVAAAKAEKAKTTKGKVVNEVVKKKIAAKKPTVKKPAAKKSIKLSAVDTILGIIIKSKKGIDTAALMKKTAFNNKKVHNIIYKLNKQGKIKSEGRGLYIKA